MQARYERQDPDRQCRLNHNRRPEVGPRQQVEEDSVDGRAADLECSFVPTRNVATSVVLQERKSVPQRRCQEDERSCQRCADAIDDLHVGTDASPGYNGTECVLGCVIMFVTFFNELKSAGVPVTLREYLTLMEAMDRDIADRRVEGFYFLSRAALIKDERHLDKFDRIFGRVFKGAELLQD